jgi:N-acetylglucosamine kinase-like BadF-type ATPase
VAYYLGIDGGGSKTTCAVGDETSLLTSVNTGPSNITRVGETRARESLHHAIREACAAAEIALGQIQRACIGVAGAGREEVAAAVRKIVAEVIPGEIQVVGDTVTSLQAAFSAGPGVIVIAGTGSIAYGRNSRGQTARAGGWGFAVSDEGSAHWIGCTLIHDLMRAIDQRPDGANDVQGMSNAFPLLREIQAAWNLHSPEEFVRAANSHPDFAALFPLIVAADADEITSTVLSRAGNELAQLAAIVTRRLFANEISDEALVHVAMIGGVFRHSQIVRESFHRELQKLDPRIEVKPEIVEPVLGALQMARSVGQSTPR